MIKNKLQTAYGRLTISRKVISKLKYLEDA